MRGWAMIQLSEEAGSDRLMRYKRPPLPQKASFLMPITVHKQENLKNAAYRLEEHIFIECKLTNCHLFYDGGSFQWSNCIFETCEWSFRGAAKDTIQLLATIGLLKAGQVPPQNLQGNAGPVN